MRRVGVTLAVLVVLALVGMLCGCGGSHGPGDAAMGKPEKPPKPGDGAIMDPAIAYMMDYTLYVMSDDGSESVKLPKPRGVYDEQPSWSPDGTMIAFWRRPDIHYFDGELCIIGVEGNETSGYTFSEPRVVWAGPSEGQTAWLANDTLALLPWHTYTDYGLMAVNINTGAQQNLSADLNLPDWDDENDVPRWTYLCSPSVAPDPDGTGYLLAYRANEQTVEPDRGTDICLVKVMREGDTWVRNGDASAGPTAVLRRDEHQSSLALSRDGTMLAFGEPDQLYTLPVAMVNTGWDYLEIDDAGLKRVYYKPPSSPSLAPLPTWSPSAGELPNAWLAFYIFNGTRRGGGVNYDIVRIDSSVPDQGIEDVTFLATNAKYCEVDVDWRWQ